MEIPAKIKFENGNILIELTDEGKNELTNALHNYLRKLPNTCRVCGETLDEHEDFFRQHEFCLWGSDEHRLSSEKKIS